MNALQIIQATVEPTGADTRTVWVRAIARGIASLGSVLRSPRQDKYVNGYELRAGVTNLTLDLDSRNEVNAVVHYRNAWVCRARVKSLADAKAFAASVVELSQAIHRCSSAQEIYDYSVANPGYRDMLNQFSADHIKLLQPGKILDASGFPITATVEPQRFDSALNSGHKYKNIEEYVSHIGRVLPGLPAQPRIISDDKTWVSTRYPVRLWYTVRPGKRIISVNVGSTAFDGFELARTDFTQPSYDKFAEAVQHVSRFLRSNKTQADFDEFKRPYDVSHLQAELADFYKRVTHNK